jgi:hypothetical protein
MGVLSMKLVLYRAIDLAVMQRLADAAYQQIER